MDIKNIKRLLTLIYKIFVDNDDEPSVIPTYPQKVSAASERTLPRNIFPAIVPEYMGIDSLYLQSYLQELENSRLTFMHSVLAVTDGKTVLSASAPGFSVDRRHITYSMAKSVIGIAAGLVYDDGKLSLDERLVDIFPEYASLHSGKKQDITVQHLLTMGISVGFGEVNTVSEEDYLNGYFDASLKEDPGIGFHYNSMTTHVLAAVLEKKVGEPLDKYLKRRLFTPLGITDYLWEKSRSGIIKGGWGLYLTPADMAKLGVLILDTGLWKGKQIVSAEWIHEMTSVQKHTDHTKGHYDYGYQIWVDSDSGSILMNGMLGQDILILPKDRTVIVLTAGNSEIFQNSEMLRITDRYFINTAFRSEAPLESDRSAFSRLLKTEKDFFSRRTFIRINGERKREYLRRGLMAPSALLLPRECYNLDGKQFRILGNGVTVLPLFTALLQNNFEKKSHTVGFLCSHNILKKPTFLLTLGSSDRMTCLSVGFQVPAVNTLNVNGELYLISVQGYFTTDEDERKVLKIAFVFPELAGEKHIKLFYDCEEPYLTVDETPGYAVAKPYIEKVAEVQSGLPSTVLSYIPKDLLKRKVKEGFTYRSEMCPSSDIVQPLLAEVQYEKGESDETPSPQKKSKEDIQSVDFSPR